MPSYPMHRILFAIILFIFVTKNQQIYAQQDTIEDPESLRESMERDKADKKEARRRKFLATLPKNHNPKTASLLALIPGAGQIYNRRYWKLPIVYGGLGALGYFMVSNYIDYNLFRTAYLHKVDLDPNTNFTYPNLPNASEGTLKIYRDNTRESAEYFLLGFVLFYGLTIVDAFVDAHLLHFDIDDDLSMNIRPTVNYSLVSQTVVPSVSLMVSGRVKERILPVRF